MKAWRLEASAINARRKDGSREPTARVQKVERMRQPAIRGMGNWLLVGLFIRAGIVPAGYGVPPKVPQTDGTWTKFKRWLNKARNLVGA